VTLLWLCSMCMTKCFFDVLISQKRIKHVLFHCDDTINIHSVEGSVAASVHEARYGPV
jgi:hypothetical protein